MKTLRKKAAKLFALVTIVKNLPLIVVLLAKKTWSTLNLVDDAQHVHTAGDPLATTPPVTDAVIHAQASAVLTTYDEFKASPPTATKEQLTQARNILITMYNKIALYIQSVARDASISAGDVTAGEAVVKRCGFKLKKQSKKPTKFFKVVSKIVGTVDITTKAVAAKAGYIRVYGTTPTKGVAPTSLSEPIYSLEVDVHISNLKSGVIYGFREASILPVKRSSSTSAVVTSTLKSATAIEATRVHKASFTEGATSHYVWSEWVYVVIM